MILAAGSGIVAAAVSGTFSATYDGYDDGESSEAPGHEIAIEGQVEVTGESAVNPTIIIHGAQHTVLDTASVQVFVEGDRSIQFDRSYSEGEVRLSADEIPSGTTLRVEYRTYYIGGADSPTMNVGQVQFDYNRPGGDRTRETFDIEATLENRPEEFVAAANTGSTLGLLQQILSYIGAGGVVLLLIGLVLKALGDSSPPGGGGPGPG